jgi:hypothetical protein
MRAAARLQRHYARRLTGEELEQLGSRQLAAEDHRTALVSAVRMKNVLGDIETDCASGRRLTLESDWGFRVDCGRASQRGCVVE